MQASSVMHDREDLGLTKNALSKKKKVRENGAEDGKNYAFCA